MVQRVLEGVRRYGAAPRAPRPPAPELVAQHQRARLWGYGGTGPTVLAIPSLINPPHILDLSEQNSLMRWLARQGLRPLLLDWGDPRAGNERADRDLSVAGHVEQLLLPLLDQLGPSVALLGYCLGGTMAIAAAQLRPVAGVATIAAPWDFDGYPAASRPLLTALWTACQPAAEALGLFPMELLQPAFWQLDPLRSLAKYARLTSLAPTAPELADFVALEDWANAGPPLTLAAAQELFVDFYRDNRTGDGNWRVGGHDIHPADLSCPQLHVVSSVDRIVPAATAPAAGTRVQLDQGHVGMVVGRRAEAGLWTQLQHWLSHLQYP